MRERREEGYVIAPFSRAHIDRGREQRYLTLLRDLSSCTYMCVEQLGVVFQSRRG